MQTVEICDLSGRIHCPRCGRRSLSAKGDVKPCAHLMFISSNETPDEPWFIHESVRAKAAEYDVEDMVIRLIESLKKMFRGADYVLFRISAPAPAGIEIYVVYWVGQED